MDIKNIIDASYLKDTQDCVSWDNFLQIINKNKFASICIYPNLIKKVPERIRFKNIWSAAVGFPLGINHDLIGEAITKPLILGFTELDYVLNTDHILERSKNYLEHEIVYVLNAGYDIVKFIVECRRVGPAGMKFVAQNLLPIALKNHCPLNFLLKNSIGLPVDSIEISYNMSKEQVINLHSMAMSKELQYDFKVAGGITNKKQIKELLSMDGIRVRRIGMGSTGLTNIFGE